MNDSMTTRRDKDKEGLLFYLTDEEHRLLTLHGTVKIKINHLSYIEVDSVGKILSTNSAIYTEGQILDLKHTGKLKKDIF